MATEPADGSEVSVTLPTALAEWLDERAASLGVDREELLVQLLGSYHAAADLDDDALTDFTDPESSLESVDAPSEGELERVERRLDALESELDDNVTDLRKRVIQLRDAVQERAEVDHAHEDLEERLDGVADLEVTVDEVEADLQQLSGSLEGTFDRLDDAESKLKRLARAVVALRRQSERIDTDERYLEHLRRAGNIRGIDVAKCVSCGETVRVSMLTEPACPHCGNPARDVQHPDSFLGRALDIRKPKLTGIEPPALESGDE